MNNTNKTTELRKTQLQQRLDLLETRSANSGKNNTPIRKKILRKLRSM